MSNIIIDKFVVISEDKFKSLIDEMVINLMSDEEFVREYVEGSMYVGKDNMMKVLFGLEYKNMTVGELLKWESENALCEGIGDTILDQNPDAKGILIVSSSGNVHVWWVFERENKGYYNEVRDREAVKEDNNKKEENNNKELDNDTKV